MKFLNILLLFAPVAIIGRFLGWSPTLLFIASAIAVIPAAGLLGQATEELAVHTGPRLGGLLNATSSASSSCRWWAMWLNTLWLFRPPGRIRWS
jgi:Ca2+/H+ antiporter